MNHAKAVAMVATLTTATEKPMNSQIEVGVRSGSARLKPILLSLTARVVRISASDRTLHRSPQTKNVYKRFRKSFIRLYRFSRFSSDCVGEEERRMYSRTSLPSTAWRSQI